MADPSTPSVTLIAGDGVAPDNDTLDLDGSGKLAVARVPAGAMTGEILGDSIEEDSNNAIQVKIDPSPGGNNPCLSATSDGLAIAGSSNGFGTRYIGTNHAEVNPLPGDIYYEISEI